MKKFYNSRQWIRKREATLKRDNYLCKECSRYGKTTLADTVHHIIPLEERNDLALDSRNLVSLCEQHHEQMHNKFNNKLSKLGLEWRERLERKYPELRDNKH